MDAQVLTVSSKGQISLPDGICRLLSIETKDFKKSLDEAKKWVESVGYKEDDVNAIIKSARKDKQK